MRWAIVLMLAGCAARVEPQASPDPVTCETNGQTCEVGWSEMHAEQCTGELPDAGACVLVPGAGADAGWWYCCP